MNKLVNLKEMTLKAFHEKYAIAHININNLEWIHATLVAAERTKSPVIIGVSEGAIKYQHGYKNVYDMVTNMINYLNISVPVALHLDHGTYNGVIKALEAGFSSVMYDGSHVSFKENLMNTSHIVSLAKKYNASVEAEVGTIGGEEDGVSGKAELADPEECKEIAKLGIDVLAAGIGNIHGVYPPTWKELNFKLLDDINKITNTTPLVLHGGTGIPSNQIIKAISLGVAKINVNTECQLAFQSAIRKYIEEEKDTKGKGFDPRKLLKPGVDAIVETVIKKITLFGSAGKA